MLFKNRTVPELDAYYSTDIKFKDDCKKIQQSFINHGIILTLLECQEMYENHSDMFCASWECGIEDYSLEYIFELLMPELFEMMKDKINRISKVTDMLELNGYLKGEKDEEKY